MGTQLEGQFIHNNENASSQKIDQLGKELRSSPPGISFFSIQLRPNLPPIKIQNIELWSGDHLKAITHAQFFTESACAGNSEVVM